MIAALYARVSTQGQEKEQTINSQIAEIEAKAKQDGNTIGVNLHFIDEGWSGELLARPALDNLRDAIKNKLFEVLYLYDLGRLSRNFLNQLILKNEIEESGIKFISLHDINAENPEGTLAQNVMGLFHEYERIKITERMRRGKLYKSKNHILFGWQAPYGYKYIKSSELNKGRFEIEEHEAKIIKMIFSWIGEEGMTIRQVIKRLYEQKITPRKSKNSYWSTSTLSKRLRDETYIGTTYYNKTLSVSPKNPRNLSKYKRIKKSSRTMKIKTDWNSIPVPVIIKKDLFEKVKRQLIINDKFAMRNKKNNYLVSNLIDCSCGCTRAGEGISGTNNLYYRCTDRVRRFPLPKQCFSKGVNAPVLDNLVWNKLTSLLSNPELRKKYYERWKKEKLSTSIKSNYIDDQGVKQQIKTLNEQEKRYLKAYGSGVITLEQYKEQSQSIKFKIQDHTSKLTPRNVDSIEKPIAIPDYETVYDKIDTVLNSYSFDKRRYIVKQIVDKVISDGNTATMTGHLPLEIKENKQENVGSQTEYRNCWITQCW